MTKNKRNKLCSCGSGKKYKYCCLINSNYAQELELRIKDAAILSLEHNENKIKEAIEILNEILKEESLTKNQQNQVYLNLAESYQRISMHDKVIDLLNMIDDESSMWYQNKLAAKTYSSLGYYDIANDLFDQIFEEVKLNPKIDSISEALVNLEAGKLYRLMGKNDKAYDCWTLAEKVFQKHKEHQEHHIRVKSNLALLLLNSDDPQKQEEGIKSLEIASSLKEKIGDIEGLANNYSNLGMYFYRKKRYSRALYYTRMDLKLSKIVGDKQNIARTLSNLSIIYAELKQLQLSKAQLKEVEKIAKEIGDAKLINTVEVNFKYINEIGRAAGLSGEKLGPNSLCACNSGKTYTDCCGRADFDPIDLPIRFGNINSAVNERLNKIIDKDADDLIKLDIILRNTEDVKQRYAWNQIIGMDGWFQYYEMPDMSNIHLNSAKSLTSLSDNSNGFANVLSTVILVVCALEAFVNQTAYFLMENSDEPNASFLIIPEEIRGNVYDYQRYESLLKKWNTLGGVLCIGYWPPPKELQDKVELLVQLRNELVHFKTLEYEQIIPPPKKEHPLVQKISKYIDVEIRNTSWPYRVLNNDLGKWSITVIEDAINYFKDSYHKYRLVDKSL